MVLIISLKFLKLIEDELKKIIIQQKKKIYLNVLTVLNNKNNNF